MAMNRQWIGLTLLALSCVEGPSVRSDVGDEGRFVEPSASDDGGVSVPCILPSFEALDFGDVPVGRTARRSFALTNPCAGLLRVDDVQVESDRLGEDSVFERYVPRLPIDIESGIDEVTIEVVARPTTYGRHDDRVALSSNDPNFPELVVAFTVDGVCESSAIDVDEDGNGIPDACEP